MKRKLLAAAMAATLMPVAVPAAVIDFNGTTPGVVLTSLTQNGYTIAAESGRLMYVDAFSFNGDGQALFTGGYGAPRTTGAASFNITTGGGLLNFKSLDYRGNGSENGTVGGALLTITGYDAGTQLFRQQIAGDFNLRTFFSSAPDIAIDRLNISTSGWILHLDDITVESAVAAIPEPATWTMMFGGFGLVGMAMRRRRRIAVAA